MRSKFDEQLALLNRDLTKMGSLCEEALALAAKALANADGQTAAKIAPIDSEIDQMERTIESLCLKLLLQQQPVARDLRQISAALKMITDMERIGDQASDIAEIIGFLNGRIGTDAQYICQMAVAAMRMVTESVEAYVKRDVAMAEATIQHDDVVDDLFLKVKESLIQMISENPKDGEYALDLLEVDRLGLDKGDRAILETIADKFGGGPVGLDTIAAALGEDSGTIEDVYEPYLIQNGLIERTPRGRAITRLAYEHLHRPVPKV